MNIHLFLATLSIFFIGCNQAAENTTVNSFRKCTSISGSDSTDASIYKTGRGALLGTRITSFEEIKTIIQIEYENGTVTADTTAPENNWVHVRHCNYDRSVISVLEKGVSQGDLVKAKEESSIWKRLAVLLGSPYAVINRKDLEKVYNLARWRQDLFGVDDLAFFDIAKSMAENINTPDLAFKNTRDSTEKGYLNTFNHITAQAIVTTCFSEELADFVADIHERHRHPELITGIFTPAQIADLEEGPVDNYVDIVNNEWGQEIGKQLKEKYGINRETKWTPELLANYLNDLQVYFIEAFQIGFKPFRPKDKVVYGFANKMNIVMRGGKHFD
jgi:hypothetical protein